MQNNPQPPQKRSRFVVNLDRGAGTPPPHYSPQGQQPYGGYGRKKRWPRVLIILGSILLLLVVGAFLYWQYYKTKPAYSLALLVDATQRNDAAAFDRVVDTGRVVESFAPQVIDEATGRLGTALTPELRQRVEALVPLILPNVTESLRGEVMRRIRELTARAEGKPFFLIALTIPYIVDIKQENDTATVRAKEGERNLELTMQRTPDKLWKVVGVKDPTLAKRIVDDIAKELPAIGTGLENEVRREIENRLPGILPGSSKGKKR
ncbi:MAG TPA: hypothetical protein VJT09_05320 [Pyrinomonadaceae bacterium]|nr:hypothetical protein [Pyrinomonadaceae bacterium]